MSGPDALAVFASVVFLVRLLPQPMRLARHGVAAGVSALSALNAVISAGAWVGYGLLADLPVVWGVSVLALVPGIWQAALLRRVTSRSDLAWSGAFVAALVAAGLAGELGVALGATVAVTAGPQVHRALTERDLSGVASATWLVAIVDASTWGAYGLAIGDAALLGYCAVLLSASITILGRITWTRRRAAQADVVTAVAATAAPVAR